MAFWQRGLVFAVVLAAAAYGDDEQNHYRVLRSVADYITDDRHALSLALAGPASYELVYDRLRYRQLCNVTMQPAAFAALLDIVIRDAAFRPKLRSMLCDYVRVDGNVIYLVDTLLKAHSNYPDIVRKAVKFFLNECDCVTFPGFLVALLADTGLVCTPLLDIVVPYYQPIPIDAIPEDILGILEESADPDHWLREYVPDWHLFPSCYMGGTYQLAIRYRAQLRQESGLIAALYRCGVRFQLSNFPGLSETEASHMAPFLTYNAGCFRNEFMEAVDRGHYEAIVVLLREPALLNSLWQDRKQQSLFLVAARLLASEKGLYNLQQALDRIPGMLNAVRMHMQTPAEVLLQQLQAEDDLRRILSAASLFDPNMLDRARAQLATNTTDVRDQSKHLVS